MEIKKGVVMMKVSLIVAIDKNRVIGKNNDLPWSIPNDWEYVMETIKSYPLIMGRKTLESLGGPLLGRRNLVLTRDKNINFKHCEMVHSIESALELCENEEEVFIFGGEYIYKMALPYVDKMYITKIHHEFNGDTFFPEVNFDEWEETFVEKGLKNDENPYDYYFHVYERKS